MVKHYYISKLSKETIQWLKKFSQQEVSFILQHRIYNGLFVCDIEDDCRYRCMFHPEIPIISIPKDADHVYFLPNLDNIEIL